MAIGRIRVRRTVALALVVGVILLAGYLIKLLPGDWTLTTEQKGVVSARSAPPEEIVERVEFDRQSWRLGAASGASEAQVSTDHAAQQMRAQTRILFEHALVLLQDGQYPQAIKALEMVITIAPRMPEAFVNLGFALYEVGEFDAARGAFLRALDLNPAQGNAYYGAAISYEALDQLELALGAMRAFLHVADGQDAFKTRARAAIWEWEAALGRGAVGKGGESSSGARAAEQSISDNG